MMRIDEKGRKLIQGFEGLRLKAYRCPANIPTIGWGHTANVRMGDEITRDEAEDLFTQDIAKFENCVHKYATVELSQNEFNALVSLAYNIGCNALKRSTLLKRLNVNRKEDAADEMLRWDNAGGRKLAGLTRRRNEEREMFLS